MKIIQGKSFIKFLVAIFIITIIFLLIPIQC